MVRAECFGHPAPTSLPLPLFYRGGPFTGVLAAAAMSSSPGRKTGEEVEEKEEEEEGCRPYRGREKAREGALGRLLRLHFLGFTV